MSRTPSRRERLRRSLRKDGLDAYLIASATNVGYLTDFTGEASCLVLTPDRQVLVSDGRFATQIAEECPDVEPHIRPVGQPLTTAVGHALAGLSASRVGFEAAHVTFADFEDLRSAGPGVEWVPVRGRVESLRVVKDRDEVEAIRHAIRVAERAFTRFRAGIRRDETEQDLVDMLEADLRRCGATGSSFPPIVAAGPRSALPHAHPDPDAPIGRQAFVLVDWGATAGGYRSDLTRLVATGKVGSKFEALYGIVLEAQQRAIAAIRPGVTAADVDAEARSVIEAAGFGRFFTHGLGHGLGRDIHEAPFLRKESDIRLRAGMVLTIEPGIYLPGWGGIRIEDDVLVTPEGCEVLTSLPRSLDSVLGA